MPWAGCSREGPHIDPWFSAGARDPLQPLLHVPHGGCVRSASSSQRLVTNIASSCHRLLPSFHSSSLALSPAQGPRDNGAVWCCLQAPSHTLRPTLRANSRDGSTEVLPVGTGLGSWLRAARQKSCPCSSVVLRGRERKEGRRLGTRRKEAGSERPASRAVGKEPRVPQLLLAPQLFVRGAKPVRLQGRGDASEDELSRMSHAKASLRQFGTR